jgi:TatD DNase family protein
MELIDTHCHLTFEPLAADVDAVIQRSLAAGVSSWITVGTDITDSQKAVELADKFGNMYAAVGIHPHDAKTVTADILARLKQIAKNPKVVAVGETGLDYHYNHSPHEDQKRAFALHLKLAAELDLPVIIHCRESFDETVEILDRFRSDRKKVVFHCFSGSLEQAKILLDKGFFLSFTGVVTFKNASLKQQAAKIVPLDRLMLETDCPYMSPEPVRKQKTNEPALLVHIAKFLADLKQIPLPDFALAVTSTSKSFFNLPSP